MDQEREERIRQRAYRLWEEEGAPEGRHHDHWDAATREIDAEGTPDVREGIDASDTPALAANPDDEDAKLDVGIDESFPASDPPALTKPKPRAKRTKAVAK